MERDATSASRLARKFSGASGKQLGRPRWQVWPCGSACTNRVSWSQSLSMRTRSSTWPEVSPLVHRHCRLRSEEHTSELQSLMRISYAVFCLKKKKTKKQRRLNVHNNNISYTKWIR